MKKLKKKEVYGLLATFYLRKNLETVDKIAILPALQHMYYVYCICTKSVSLVYQSAIYKQRGLLSIIPQHFNPILCTDASYKNKLEQEIISFCTLRISVSLKQSSHWFLVLVGVSSCYTVKLELMKLTFHSKTLITINILWKDQAHFSTLFFYFETP